MSVNTWEHFFKPEVRASGRTLFAGGKISVSQPSDTEIIVYVRTAPGFKVTLKSTSVASNTINVDCNCPAARKNQFCKHIWAGLLATEQKNSDFFESKSEITKNENNLDSKESIKKTAFKEKQAAYRKQQYQKQKQRQKNYKDSKKTEQIEPKFPIEIEKALKYFAENGIELKASLSKEAVGSAKKKLARIFHPDVGGSHDEIVALNCCADILIHFIERREREAL